MTSKTIEEKLDSMNIEEYELLLKGCEETDKSKVLPEHAKIIDQIQHQMKTKPEEAITSLTNSKHSSSLQSLVQKEKGKNHHKVPNNSSRPDDSYQQQQNQSQTNTSGSKTVIPYNTSQSSSATVGAKQLPARYFFNCVQDDGDPFPNQERPPETDGEKSSESRNVDSVSRRADLHDDRSGLANKSNIDLRETYPAVQSCIVRPPFNESLHGQFKGSTNSNLTSSSLMPNYPTLISSQTLSHPQAQVVSPANSLTTSGFSSSPPPSNSARGSSDGSSRRLDETHGRKKAKAKDKEDKKVKSYPAPVTQYNAETDVDKILIQLEGPSIEGKRGNKNKKRGVKSMSLDDDNLSIAAKKTADRVTALKTTANNNSNNNNNSHNIQSSSSGKAEENKKDNNNIDKEPFKGSSSSPPQGININNNNITTTNNNNKNNNSKRNSGSQASGERESDGEDNRSPVRSKGDVNFTLVIRGKRKNNKTASTSSSIGNPVGKGDDRQEDSSRKIRSRGERRKSVGSVPGSDQSEGSDDGSVRSLPAGECTKRENIPKSCASSGGTPQTSYADIARLTKDEDTKKEVPQALEDYPSLQAFENSEGSDDSSDRFVPTEDLATAPATIKDGAAGKQSSNVVAGSALTSYADIARLASHEEQKKEESNNNKKDQASEEFPELNSSASLTQQQESCSAEPSSLLSPSSDLSAGKYPSSDSSAFPQLIATTSSATTKSNSSSQGSSNIKNMSSVVSSSAVAGAAAKVTNSLVPPAPASSTTPGAPTPTTTTTTQKAQTNSIASPTVVSAACSAATKSTDHKNNITTNVTGGGGGGAGNPVVVSAAAALNPRVSSLASPSSVPVVNSSADNVLRGGGGSGGGGTNSKSNPDRHSPPTALHSNASKNSSSPICVNGHLSDSERDMKVMKRSDIPGAKMMTMDKSSISIAAPTQQQQQQQLNVVDSGLSQCTEAVVFCGENFKEPPQLPSKGLQFEFGFNVSEVLDDINKKVSPDAAVPPTGISVKHTKGNNNNLPSPPQKDGGYPSSKGYHHHGSSNKQQQQQQGGYGPRSHRGEDPRHRGEVVVDRNGSSMRVQNNNRSDSQGQRKIMPNASGHYNEVDDSSSSKPPASGGVMSDAQVVSAKSDVRLSSTGMSERSQSFKAAQPKAAGHNSKKSSFQTVQPVFAEGVVVQPPHPAQTPPSLLPPSEVVYSKQQPAVVSQYPLGAAPIAIHGGGGVPVVPPVYGVAGYVTASASPSSFSNRLPAPPPHMTGPPFVPPPQPYEATATPQYIQQVYSIRTAPPLAPVATTTGHQEDHSTMGNAQPPQMPPPTGPVVVNADYLMNLSASSSTTTSHPHHGPAARQPQQSTVVHSQRGFNHQVPAPHHHPHHQQQQNYSANVVDNVGGGSAFTSEAREVNSAAATTTVTGSLTYPIDFASRFVSPDPSRYSSANVEDLRNYLTRRQRECQRLRNENENVREIT